MQRQVRCLESSTVSQKKCHKPHKWPSVSRRERQAGKARRKEGRNQKEGRMNRGREEGRIRKE
jgi:hypothetical protein